MLATVDGKPAIYGTYLRASRLYSSYVDRDRADEPAAGAVRATSGHRGPRSRSLEGTARHSAGHPARPAGDLQQRLQDKCLRRRLLPEWREYGTLTKGVASEVYYRDGALAIGVWGRTVRMTPDVVGVRQNLHLIVIAAGSRGRSTQRREKLGRDPRRRVLRLAVRIGITRSGRIVYAYGPALNVRELADLLRRAGAVTAMELDINPEWMSFMYYQARTTSNPRPVNLLPTQIQPPIATTRRRAGTSRRQRCSPGRANLAGAREAGEEACGSWWRRMTAGCGTCSAAGCGRTGTWWTRWRTGRRRIRFLRSYDYAVAVLDWRMPEVSGLEVLQWMRRHESPAAVLMLTARDAPADRVTGLDQGADDYLVKPFDFGELLARMRALQRRRGRCRPPSWSWGTCASTRSPARCRSATGARC